MVAKFLVHRLRLAKEQLCSCITLFCTFLSRCCTTAPWNFPILLARFIEWVSTTQKFSFSFSKLRDGPFGFNPENFANMKLNKIYEVWNSANPLFKWRFDLLSSRNFATMATWRKMQLTTSPLHCICKKKCPIVQFDITLTQSHSDPYSGLHEKCLCLFLQRGSQGR